MPESQEEIKRIQGLLDEYVAEKHAGRTSREVTVSAGQTFIDSPEFQEWMAKRKAAKTPPHYETKVITPEKK